MKLIETKTFSNRDSYYELEEKFFKSKEIGTSDCNAYVPFYSLFNHTLLDINDNIILEYYKPTYTNTSLYIRNYSELEHQLRCTDTFNSYKFTIAGLVKQLFFNRHVLYTQDLELLFCLGIKTDYVLNETYKNISDKPEYNQLILIVNNSFLNNPTYKNVYRKLNKIYIEPLARKGVDIVYTNNVDKWFFQNNFVQPKFKSVPEMMKHLKVEIPTLLTQ